MKTEISEDKKGSSFKGIDQMGSGLIPEEDLKLSQKS